MQSKLLIAAKANMNGAQSTNNNVATTMNLPAESYDTNNMHDLAVNNPRISLSLPADLCTRYLLGICYMEFATNGTSSRRMEILNNNGSWLPAVCVLAAGGNPTRLSFLSNLGGISLNDFFTLRAIQISGGVLNVNDGYLAVAPCYGGPPDNLKTFICKPIFSGAQSIANNDTTQSISFSSSEIDNHPGDDPQWSPVSPTRVTIQQSGRYLFSALIKFAANTTGDRGAEIRLNGATRLTAQMIKGVTNAITHDSYAVGVAQLSAGDFLELYAYQNSGAPLNATQAELCVWGETNANLTDFSGAWFHR